MSNDVKLQEGHPVDENLRPIKVGDKATALETAQHGNGARVVGDLEFTGNLVGHSNTISTNTIRSEDLTINDSGDITLDTTGRNIFIAENGTNKFKYDTNLNTFEIFSTANTSDIFKIDVNAEGATSISTTDADTAVAHLSIVADGHVEFDGCAVGFDLETPTYNASDTDVDFTDGNKQFVTFGAGNITDLNLIFPDVSGNFVLLLKQDGTGSRTVTNYKAWDLVNSDAADGSATVKFAGGSNPTLTTDANHVDIISFFWDADNEIAYGVASLDFQF